MHEQQGGGATDRATFARALESLKRRGSNVLLVGAESRGAHDTVCQQLLGNTEQESRYRLRITDGGDCSACGGDGGEFDRHRTIEHSMAAEESDAARGADDNPPLDGLGIEIVEAIDAIADHAGGLAPSELRVCVDSLAPLVRASDAETVFRLLHVATARVDYARGMGHYHLPFASDHDIVTLLEPLFDAVVTVRSRGGTEEQRWHLRRAETTSGWLEVDRTD